MGRNKFRNVKRRGSQEAPGLECLAEWKRERPENPDSCRMEQEKSMHCISLAPSTHNSEQCMSGQENKAYVSSPLRVPKISSSQKQQSLSLTVKRVSFLILDFWRKFVVCHRMFLGAIAHAFCLTVFCYQCVYSRDRKDTCSACIEQIKLAISMHFQQTRSQG